MVQICQNFRMFRVDFSWTSNDFPTEFAVRGLNRKRALSCDRCESENKSALIYPPCWERSWDDINLPFE